ncbi:putative ammonium transporter 1 isoform X1 [Tubulanus polymorphus]|uniref:putative ammonium transporter 1 isoform X1 n=1 Tax=Tubulanus polymorphus TaxID=672921 RepID=UPI003DA5EE8B
MASNASTTLAPNPAVSVNIADIVENIDVFFVLTMAMVIFFMQCGFAFLEAGSVRSKNTTNILMKNFLDAFVSGIAYWSVGYPFAFGKGNVFIGHRYFFSESLPPSQYHLWFFHFVFAATAATIVSGAMAERCEFIAYLVYSFVITGIVYPIVTHWTWSSEGWLSQGNGVDSSYQDFAGSGVVHLLGGTAALVGAAILKPRLGRFDETTSKPNTIPGHSVPLGALGGFILVFGFFAFNGGSQASISQPGDGAAIAEAIMNTVLAGSFAAFSALIAFKVGFCCTYKCKPQGMLRRPWSLLRTINAALTGMVAICAGCNVLYPWGAAVVGAVAGLLYLGASYVVLYLKIDDPLDAVAVHGVGGFWGLVAQPLLKMETGIVFLGTRKSFLDLAWNMIGAVAIIAWTAVICVVMFLILRVTGVLRVSKEYEIKGMDIPKHGEPAYPNASYGDGWPKENSESQNGESIAFTNKIGMQECIVTEPKDDGVDNENFRRDSESDVTKF